MMIDPVSSTEVVLRLIQDRQTVSYVGISAMIMLIWDYGGLTNYIFDRMAPLMLAWLSISPVIMLDKEVSPIPLFRISDARYITL